MIKKPKISVGGRKKGEYKRILSEFDWNPGLLVFTKEAPRMPKEKKQ